MRKQIKPKTTSLRVRVTTKKTLQKLSKITGNYIVDIISELADRELDQLSPKKLASEIFE